MCGHVEFNATLTPASIAQVLSTSFFIFCNGSWRGRSGWAGIWFLQHFWGSRGGRAVAERFAPGFGRWCRHTQRFFILCRARVSVCTKNQEKTLWASCSVGRPGGRVGELACQSRSWWLLDFLWSLFSTNQVYGGFQVSMASFETARWGCSQRNILCSSKNAWGNSTYSCYNFLLPNVLI